MYFPGDPLLALDPIYQGASAGARERKDTRIDKLWEAQTRELDPVKRKALVHDLERLMLIENYYLSINWWERIIIHHRRVKGWHFNSSHLQGQELMEVWLDQ